MARFARVVVGGKRQAASAFRCPLPAFRFPLSAFRRQDVFFCDADRLVSQHDLLPSMVPDWCRFVSEADDEDDLHRFRKESSVGRRLGDEGLIMGLERKLGRMLRRRPLAAQGSTKINKGERNK